MKIEFYHIDAFEVANYEPIWRHLREMGVDASMVAVPDARNTAASGWFDFERFNAYCTERTIPFSTQSDPCADLAVTTQNVGILRDYAKRIRLMYCPTPYTTGWSMQQQTVQPFDAVLVHGNFFADSFSRWLPRSRLPIIGYPRYDDFFAGRLKRDAIRARWGVNDEHPVLAFMTTWENNTAFDAFFPALLKLRDRFQIILRPHHCTQRMEPHRMALMRESGLLILDHAFDLIDVYAGADFVVSDVRSGSLFEACMCDLPTVAMVRDKTELTGWLADNKVDQVTRLCNDPFDLERAVDDALTSTQYVSGRARWAEYHVAYRDGSAAKHAAEALIQLASPAKAQVVVLPVYAHKVSVILPTYNHAQFLPQAVAGILSQKMTDLELIIVNDGSTDDTQAYLSSLTDPRVKVINRENGGLPSALNRGFSEATGEYFTWTSADNVTGPAWLEQLVAGLSSAPPSVGIVYSGFALVDVSGAILSIRRGQTMELDSLAAKNPGMASFLYRASIARLVGNYDETLNGAEDWDMWLRMLEVCDASYVNDVQYYYRLHNNSMTSTIPDKVAAASQAALRQLRQRQGDRFDLDTFYPRLREAKDQGLARWQAKTRLARFLIDSPFCSASWTAELLIEALHDRYAPEVHRNLLVLLCRCNAWDLAVQSVDEARSRVPSQELDDIRALLINRDTGLFAKYPLFQTPEAELQFELGRAP